MTSRDLAAWDAEIEAEFQRATRGARNGKRKRAGQFVKVPLWWAEQAARATGTPKAFLWIWLLHLAWKARSNTFPLPNKQLYARGVHRNTKTRTLRELEAAGLIRVERRARKSPMVTLLFT
jgi:hypothetical protein